MGDIMLEPSIDYISVIWYNEVGFLTTMSII